MNADARSGQDADTSDPGPSPKPPVLYRTLSGTKLTCLGHQVAGQSPLLKREDGKVCKPLVDQEVKFYESLKANADFIKFAPTFYGLSCVQRITSLEGFGEGSHDNVVDRVENFVGWGWNLFRKKQAKISKGIDKDKKTQYIVLQDLTHKYKRPCILDLKMGTRQHGENVSPKKKSSMISKCLATTSSTLGFRVCGLEVYQPMECKYIHRDKYYGRRLTAQTVQEALIQFVDNGVRYRVELWQPFIKRLQALLALFEKQRQFHFYGSSLLFIYEGAMADDIDETSINVTMKMVDFAHTYETQDGTLDEGYIFGVRNLLRLITGLARISNSSPSGTTI